MFLYIYQILCVYLLFGQEKDVVVYVFGHMYMQNFLDAFVQEKEFSRKENGVGLKMYGLVLWNN